MSALTHKQKAALSKKVDEVIGDIGTNRRHIHDAIRGGAVLDVIHLLLNLHDRTVKRETKAVIEYEDTIFILRNQLADAERDLAEARRELSTAQEQLAELHKVRDEQYYLNLYIADLKKARDEHHKAALEWRAKAYKLSEEKQVLLRCLQQQAKAEKPLVFATPEAGEED
jgi:hypothetical protein